MNVLSIPDKAIRQRGGQTWWLYRKVPAMYREVETCGGHPHAQDPDRGADAFGGRDRQARGRDHPTRQKERSGAASDRGARYWPLIATAIATLAPPPDTFSRARDFAAWLGLAPRQHSTGGKQRPGATIKMGERSPRRLPMIVANSVIIKRHVHAAARPGTWLGGMLSRKPPMLVRVALANKMARIVWALMTRGGVYKSPAMAA